MELIAKILCPKKECVFNDVDASLCLQCKFVIIKVED